MLSIVIGVLFGLLGALLILGAIILVLRGLRRRGLVLGFGLGMVVVLRVRGRLRFWFLGGLGGLLLVLGIILGGGLLGSGLLLLGRL